MEYFDPTHGGDGSLCGEGANREILFDHPFPSHVTSDEARWAYDAVLTRLNLSLREASSNYGWKYAGGIASKFVRHGYCPEEHWVVQYDESKSRQGDDNGTLHPNASGHVVYEKALWEVLSSLTAK